MDTDQKPRLEKFIEKLHEKLGQRESRDLDNLPLNQRSYQLAMNLALFSLKTSTDFNLPVDLKRIASLRRSLDSLGMGRDVKVPEAYTEEERKALGGWTSEQLALVKQGYKDERMLFEQFFPRSEYPSVYEEENQDKK